MTFLAAYWSSILNRPVLLPGSLGSGPFTAALNATSTQNLNPPPGGVQGAWSGIEDTNNAAHRIEPVARNVIAAGQTVIARITLRSLGRTKGIFFVSTSSGGTNRFGVTYDLTARTLVAFTAGAGALASSSIAALGGGWFRIVIVGAQNSTDTTSIATLRLADSGGATTYAGDGVSGVAFY